MTLPPVRFAIAGAGHMGTRHGACIRAGADAQLVAVWSRTPQHAAALAARADAEVASSVEELVHRSDVDAVIVATATANHAETALSAIRAGKHVLVEKPLARTLREAELLIRAAERANVLLLTGHVLRFYPVFTSLHDHILAGEIRAPAVIHMSRETSTIPTGWRSDLSEGGGVALDLGIHEFDWLLWTLGRVERVYCKAVCRNSASAHDYAMTTLRLSSGAIAHIESSAVRGSGFRISGELAGDGGMLTYDSELDQALRMDSEPVGRATWEGLPTAYAGPSPYVSQLEHWVRCIRGLELPAVTPEQAYGALQVALAALESAKTGKAVNL